MTPTFRYNWFLMRVAIPNVSNDTTLGSDLSRFAKKSFGNKFHGVYMRDEIPTDFNASRPYGIINLDRSTNPRQGSHWIAVAFQKPRELLVYDSFGALHKTPNELTRIYGKSRGTEPDREQELDEQNCGARCIAWLLLAECFPKDARHI